MPPKFKFTKDEILSAAFEIVEKNGIDALTARSLAEKLTSSPRPIFSVFTGMDEVRAEIVKMARELYSSYVADGLNSPMPFEGVGESYIRFAAEHSFLFNLLFMHTSKRYNKYDVLPMIEENYDIILQSITSSYSISVPEAENFYKHLWIYSHGIAVLMATGVCSFGADEVSVMLNEVGGAIITRMRRVKND